jgi:hypothetical protein
MRFLAKTGSNQVADPFLKFFVMSVERRQFAGFRNLNHSKSDNDRFCVQIGN